MIFADYLSVPYSNLANTKTTMLFTTSNTLVVNSIIVCNLTGNNIRFNLQKSRASAAPVEIFYIHEFEIKPYHTVDILKELRFNVFLQYQENPSIVDSLICFSNGSKQLFDCEVSYTRLNEAPYSLNRSPVL